MHVIVWFVLLYRRNESLESMIKIPIVRTLLFSEGIEMILDPRSKIRKLGFYIGC